MIRKTWQQFGDYRLRRAQRKGNIQPKNVYEDVQQGLRNEVPIGARRWRRAPDLSSLEPLIITAQREAVEQEHVPALSAGRAWYWLRALVLQAPRAAQAQQIVDSHHGHGGLRGEKLYELIDFNDAYVATALALSKDQLSDFAEEAKRLMDWFCKRVGVRGFSHEQYEAIVQGLSREVAVYRGLIAVGYNAQLSGRSGDALGVDIVVHDPRTGMWVNIDCKAPSAYLHRIYTLEREGRLTAQEVNFADLHGFAAVVNGHGKEKTQVVLWRIDREQYGEIVDFQFTETTQLKSGMQRILELYGKKDS